MGLRFYKRVHLFPGVSVNVSRSGPSLSVGVRGAHVTVGRTGITRTVGLPGSGIYYTSRSGYHSGFHSAHGEPPLAPSEQGLADRKAERLVGILVMVIVGLVAMLFVALAR